MAVELDLPLTRPFDPRVIQSEIAGLLHQRHRLDAKPDVRLRVEKCLLEADSSIQDVSVFFSIADLAEVWVMSYPDPSDSSTWVSVSYGHFRSAESKLLCLATAVVL